MFSRHVNSGRSRQGFAAAVRDEASRALVASVAYRATADVVSKAVTLAITVAAARVLPATDFGVLAVAMTTGWILSVASDAGLPLFLAKHVAQEVNAGRPQPFAAVSRVMRVRVGAGVVAAVAGLIVATVIVPVTSVAAFFVIVVAQLLIAVLETLAHAYRGIGRSDIESRVMLGQRSLTAAAAITVFLVHPSLLWVSVALAVPPALALLLSVQIARGLFTGSQANTDALRLTWPRFAREVAPVGAGILLSALYFRCDVFFVERWHGLEAVGLYNSAFRSVEALRLLPAALLAVTFPALCVAQDTTPLKRLSVALAASGVVIMGLLYATAPDVLAAVYGARFVGAAPALQILSLALPLFFVNYALTHQVIAWDGHRAYLAIAAAALTANLALNTLLIPTRGLSGAAASTLITELVVTAGCLIAIHAARAVKAVLPGAARNMEGRPFAVSVPGDSR